MWTNILLSNLCVPAWGRLLPTYHLQEPPKYQQEDDPEAETDVKLMLVMRMSPTVPWIYKKIRQNHRDIKTKAFNIIVRATSEYAARVWDQGQKRKEVQRRAARYECGKYSHCESVSAMMDELGWESLEQRRSKTMVTMLFKVIHTLLAIPQTHLIPATGTTRGNKIQLHQLCYQNKPITNIAISQQLHLSEITCPKTSRIYRKRTSMTLKMLWDRWPSYCTILIYYSVVCNFVNSSEHFD